MFSLSKTALHPAHMALGARLVDFAGWEMPIQYSGILAEHQAVRTAAGLFDVSHMGRIRVRGKEAGAVLDSLVTSDIAGLTPGRSRYGLLCNEKGGILDDLVVGCLTAEDYLVVCNAASWDRVRDWLAIHAHGKKARLIPQRDETAMIAIQGPKAAQHVASLAGEDVLKMKRFGVEQARLDGALLIVSRTGYTGEDGFELIIEIEKALDLWDMLLKGATPCGLGARDTLRLEAGLLLYGQDMDTETTPLEAGLDRFVNLHKEFVGVEALRRQAAEGLTRRMAGFILEGRQAPRHGYPLFVSDVQAGVVTSGSYSPTLEKGIGLAYLPVDAAKSGTEVCVDLRGRKACGEVVNLPFYRR